MHSGKTCAEYDTVLRNNYNVLLQTNFILQTLKKEEAAVAHWKAVHTKQCPNCRVHIEKNGGCDHFTCDHCK